MDTKYLKNVLIYILSALLAIGAGYYVLYHIFDGFSSALATSPATLVSERESVNATAYIFRDEEVITSEYGGAVNYIVGNGDKVGRGALLANVYQSGDGDSIRRQIEELDERIALLKASNIEKNVVVSGTSKIDAEISSLYRSASAVIEGGDLAYAMHLKDDMLSKLNRRRIIIGEVKNYDTQIAALVTQRAALTSMLTGNYKSAVADRSGYFFYNVDGYESIYRASELSEIGLDSLFSLFETEKNDVSDRAVGKLVTGHTWYIAVPTGDGDHADYTVGKKYNITFPYNYDTEVSMTLERVVSETGRREAVLIFSTSTMPEDFSYARAQSVVIEKSTVTGYRIPTSALRMVDGKEGVYILYGSTVYFRRVEVIFESDGYFIVAERDPSREDASEYLGHSDTVISRGKDLYDGKIIE